MLLPFQKECVLDGLHESQLLIMGKGLGMLELMRELVRLYSSPKLLVLLIGLDDEEEESGAVEAFTQAVTGGFNELRESVPYTRLTAANSTPEERAERYLEGGVVWLTGRILVSDLLGGRVPVALVTGLLVGRAERVMEGGLEAFACAMLRAETVYEGSEMPLLTPFIKAFSDCPEQIRQPERLLKALQLTGMSLWPRFHQLVQANLDVSEREGEGVCVEELLIALPNGAKLLQVTLLTIIDSLRRELQGTNPALLSDTLQEHAQSGPQRPLRPWLDALWPQMSAKARQLTFEIMALQRLVGAILECDAASMLRRLETLIAAHRREQAYWLGLDATGVALRVARERFAGGEGHCKWRALLKVLQEEEQVETVIVCGDYQTAQQLRTLLAMGLDAYLARQRARYEAWQRRFGGQASAVGSLRKRRRTVAAPVNANSQKETVIHGDISSESEDEGPLTVAEHKVFSEEEDPAFAWLADHPARVIMYNPSLSLIRSIECHAAKAKRPLQLLCLTVRGSVEEEGHLLAVRAEKEAFERLIKLKANLVINPAIDYARRRKGIFEWDADMAEVASRLERGDTIEESKKVKFYAHYC